MRGDPVVVVRLLRERFISCGHRDDGSRFRCGRSEPLVKQECHDRFMAQRTITTFVDDLDGTDLGRGPGPTLRFGVDGHTYEIDLSEDNAAALREVLRPYTEAGRRIAPSRTRRRRR